MSQIGLFFASSTGNCETAARKISEKFSPTDVDVFDLMHFDGAKVPRYKYYIFGIPTWDRNQLHEDWQDFLPLLSRVNLSGKKFALYGLGDQNTYADNFVDNMGILYEWLLDKHADIVGFWPLETYQFRRSYAVRKAQFVGLAIDEDSQSHLTDERIDKWVSLLKSHFRV